jgi:hypothetical protein
MGTGKEREREREREKEINMDTIAFVNSHDQNVYNRLANKRFRNRF